MNKIIKYFDLASSYRHNNMHEVADEKKLHVFPQYIALLLGIMAQPFFKSYIESGSWEINISLGWLIGSIIVSIMALPAIYKNSFDVTKPLFVQLCVIFTAGVGWQNIASIADQMPK